MKCPRPIRPLSKRGEGESGVRASLARSTIIIACRILHEGHLHSGSMVKGANVLIGRTRTSTQIADQNIEMFRGVGCLCEGNLAWIA